MLDPCRQLRRSFYTNRYIKKFRNEFLGSELLNLPCMTHFDKKPLRCARNFKFCRGIRYFEKTDVGTNFAGVLFQEIA